MMIAFFTIISHITFIAFITTMQRMQQCNHATHFLKKKIQNTPHTHAPGWNAGNSKELIGFLIRWLFIAIYSRDQAHIWGGIGDNPLGFLFSGGEL